jgi:MFS family permease
MPIKKSYYRAIMLPWIIWILGTSFFFAEYFVRVSPSVMTHALTQTFHVNALALGGISALFYYAYVGMQIPVGILVDRFSAYRLIIMAMILTVLGAVLFAKAQNLTMLFGSRFLMGFGGAFAFVTTLRLTANWFHPKYFALLAGLTQAMGMLGATVGDAPMSMMFHAFGWRDTMMGIALVFLLLALFASIFIEDYPLAAGATSRPITHIAVWPALKGIVSNKTIWINCLFIGLLYAPTVALTGLWGTTFLSHQQHIGITLASGEMGMAFVGLAVGCPVLGWLSDRLGSRVTVMRLSAIASLFFIILVLFKHAMGLGSFVSTDVGFVLLFCYGFFNSGIVPSYALAKETVKLKHAGIALGITNMASVLVGSILLPVVGALLDWHVTLTHAFIMLPICLLAAFALTFAIKNTERETS